MPLYWFTAYPVKKWLIGTLLKNVSLTTKPVTVRETVFQLLHELFHTPLLDFEITQEAVDLTVSLRSCDRPVARVVVAIG